MNTRQAYEVEIRIGLKTRKVRLSSTDEKRAGECAMSHTILARGDKNAVLVSVKKIGGSA